MRKRSVADKSVNSGSARRSVLLAVARRAFSTHGYDEVGLRDIAASAGVSVGQVVREFGSKEALLDATLASVLDAPVRTGKPRANEIARALSGQGDQRSLEPWLMLVLSGTSAGSADAVRARLPGFEAHMARQLRAGEAQSLRAATVIGVLVGLVLCGRLLKVLPLAGPGGEAVRRYVRAAVGMIDGGTPRPLPRRRPQGPAARAAITAAADAEFSRKGYDHASIRAIAASAGIDPAQLLRSFGSKEALFLAVLKGHFVSHSTTPPWETIRQRLLHSLNGRWTPLEITLRSASSRVAGPIIKRDMEARFIGPFADVLPGPHAEVRAALAISVMVGIAYCRDVLGVKVLRTHRKALEPYVAALLDLVEAGHGIFGTTRSRP